MNALTATMPAEPLQKRSAKERRITSPAPFGPLGARVRNRSDAVESLHPDGDVNLLVGVGAGAVAEQVLAGQLGAEPLENRLQIVSGLRLGVLPAGSAGELAQGARVERARLKADREDAHARVTSLRSCVLEGREASGVGAVGEDDDGADGQVAGLDQRDRFLDGVVNVGSTRERGDVCDAFGDHLSVGGERHDDVRLLVEGDHRHHLARLPVRRKRARRLHRADDGRALHAVARVDDEDDAELASSGLVRGNDGHVLDELPVFAHLDGPGLEHHLVRQREHVGAVREPRARGVAQGDALGLALARSLSDEQRQDRGKRDHQADARFIGWPPGRGRVTQSGPAATCCR